MTWRHPDGVINVRDRGVLAAVTVGLAAAGSSRIGDTGGRGDLAPKQPADGPQDALGGEGGAAVAKGVGEVQVDLAVPADCEEWGAGRVKQQESVPTTKINFKHLKFRTWEPAAVRLNHGDDVFRSWQRKLPSNSAVAVSRYPGVDSGEALTAVNDSPAKVRAGLLDGTNGAAEHGEREAGFVEWAEESTELQLLLDVGGDITGGQSSRGKVGFGVARLGRRHEGDVPAKSEVLEEGFCIKVGPECRSPGGNVEGGEG